MTKHIFDKIKYASILAAVALTLTTPASATIVIRLNPGGKINEFYRSIHQVRERRELIIVDGECWSACSSVLNLIPDGLMCATPRAMFAFHRAFSGPPGTPEYEDDGGDTERQMRELPLAISMYLTSKGGISHRWIFLKGKAMVSRVPQCTKAQIATAYEPDPLKRRYD